MPKSIRWLRRNREETQEHAARALGVSLPTYKKWEKDLTGAKLADVFRVAKHYGVNPWDIDFRPIAPQKLN